MIDLHGIVYAYHSYPALNELVVHRTSSSLPFCSRYRLIDFALSSLTNAGVRDVGVIMQRDYQSLLDHLEGGKDWDLSRRGSSGLTLLPPYGLHENDFGEYRGCMEALGAMLSYIRKTKQNNIILFRGDLAVNLNIKAVYEHHIASGEQITAVCADKAFDSSSDGVRLIPDGPDTSHQMHFRHSNSREGLPSLEVYIIRKSLLLELIEWSRANGRIHFHRDALAYYLRNGGSIGLYVHKGYAAHICSVADYYGANLDMLLPENRADLFPPERPVYTKGRSSVSTYYGEASQVKNSLIADGCYIEGQIENCVLFRGVAVEKGAVIKNCVLMQDTRVCEGASLSCIIADKNVSFSKNLVLNGNEKLPLTVKKGTTL